MVQVENALPLESPDITHLSNSSTQNFAFFKAMIASNQVGLRLEPAFPFVSIKGPLLNPALDLERVRSWPGHNYMERASRSDVSY